MPSSDRGWGWSPRRARTAHSKGPAGVCGPPTAAHLQAWLGGRFPQDLEELGNQGSVGKPRTRGSRGPACARESCSPVAADRANLEPLSPCPCKPGPPPFPC